MRQSIQATDFNCKMAIYTRLQYSEIEKILAAYHIHLVDFIPVQAGNSNSNYRIRAKEGEFMLTLAEEKSFQETENLATLIHWLDEHHHFKTTPVYRTIKGAMVTEYADKPVLLKRWVPGLVIEDLSTNELFQIGNALAQLHRIPAPAYLPKLPPHGHQVFSSVIGKKIDKNYESWLENKLQFIDKNLPRDLPRGLVHGDLFFDNVLFENDQLKAVIDFEETCNYFLVFDLGMASIGLCQKDGKIDLAKIRSLINGYESQRRLEPDEKKSLLFFIDYAATIISYWRYWKYNIHSPTPERKTKHWEMLRVAQQAERIDKVQFANVVFGEN